MSRSSYSFVCAAFLASLVSTAAGAQTLADTPEVAPLPPPMSITARYVPVKAPRAPLALLVEDAQMVAAAPSAPVAVQRVAVEEVGARLAIAALAPGRLAISVSTAHQEERHE